jgi:hypothetical protein
MLKLTIKQLNLKSGEREQIGQYSSVYIELPDGETYNLTATSGKLHIQSDRPIQIEPCAANAIDLSYSDLV